MRNLFLFLSALFLIAKVPAMGQSPGDHLLGDLKSIRLSKGNTVHILSPEPIRYVDISSKKVAADLPMENLLRLKIVPDSLNLDGVGAELGSVTLVGENYLTQFRALQSEQYVETRSPVLYQIDPLTVVPLEQAENSLSRSQMRSLSYTLLAQSDKRPLRKEERFGVGIHLNSIRTVGDFIFLDLSFTNKTKLSFRPDQLRFFIEDKKITKATNVQSVEIEPIWQFGPFDVLRKKNRNIYILKKVTFPGSKILRVSLTEKQMSGRTIDLKIKYQDILNADSL
ncbi:conjugative transposon protein TraN [Sphingobacterium siyangense]|uniref:Conjugative transposon TraN protein n=1 Tax=Sphingobacterium siyangense TaxID=459529 RepID=A0A562M736_9SPHI|nr:conjugative transposon protein TraN [Sphingobacterium siyangense]TWI15690.1 conjugative transposon TraN protein [Sphingobacterium siyangense]